MSFFVNMLGFRSPTPQIKIDDQKGLLGPDVIAEKKTNVDERIKIAREKIAAFAGSFGSTDWGKFTFKNDDLARSLTLADFQVLDDPSRKEIIERLDLGEPIKMISSNCSFIKRLNAVAYPTLNQVSLHELQKLGKLTTMQDSVISLALVPDEEIAALPVQSLAEHFREVPNVVYLRLQAIQNERPDLVKACGALSFDPEDGSIPVSQIALMNPQEIERRAKFLPAQAFALLTDEQLMGLDFSKLSPDQVRCALLGGQGTPEAIGYRFSILSNEQFSAAIAKGGDALAFLPRMSCPRVPLSKMSSDQINAMFPDRWSDAEMEADKRRFALIPHREVFGALKNLKGKTHLLSDGQIQAMDKRVLTVPLFKDLFLSSDEKEEIKRHKIAQLSAVLVNHLLHQMPQPDALCEALSDEQIRGLDWNSMTPHLFKEIFLEGFDEEKSRRRVSLLPSAITNRFIGQLGKGFAKLLSDRQIKEINPTQLKQEQIDVLFPSFSVEKLIPGYTYSFREDRGGYPHHYEYKGPGNASGMSNLTEAEVQKMIEEKRALCLKRLELLNPDQRAAIRPKLSPEVADYLERM